MAITEPPRIAKVEESDCGYRHEVHSEPSLVITKGYALEIPGRSIRQLENVT
jgi:hypothetical protein